MAKHRAFFKLAAIIAILAGLMIIVSGFLILFSKNSPLGTLIGLLVFILLFLIGGVLIGSFRSLWGTEVGSWGSSFVISLISSITLGLLLFPALAVFSVRVLSNANLGNLAAGSIAALIFIVALFVLQVICTVLLYVWRVDFMPSKEEIEAGMRRIGKRTVKTVAECPRCHSVVQRDWINCPQCGFHLPRVCANCGKELTTEVEKCPECGEQIEHIDTAIRTVETLKLIAAEEAKPEARSVRYARLAEAYLKAGDADQALETYKQAISFTEFDTKRCNFMVKMAMVMHNNGRDKEAQELLEAALKLDPQDASGAGVAQKQILAHEMAAKAEEASKAGLEGEAVHYAEQSLAIDPTDYHGVGVIKARVLVREAEAAARSDRARAVKLLDQAVALDPSDVTSAMELRDSLTPREKSKQQKELEKQRKKELKQAQKEMKKAAKAK